MKIIIFIILLIIIIGLFAWQEIYNNIYIRTAVAGGKIFTIEKGESSKNIAIDLKKEGFIKFPISFRVYIVFSRNAEKIQAGSYWLDYSMNVVDITEKFVKGDVYKMEITIPEGFSLKQIEEESITTFPFKIKDFKDKYSFLSDAPEELSLEGFLFPDTYEFSYGADNKKIATKMLDNFDGKLTPDLRNEIEKQNKTIFEIITMASLIEKEVRTKEDKEIVSGILWKRLKNKIPLQVDSTISYITGKQTVSISRDETKIDSPYNTYKYLGLPLGPICNPGLESIEAAVYPKDSPYWYYLSTPDGKTIFSKTLEEHNIAKAKYLNND